MQLRTPSLIGALTAAALVAACGPVADPDKDDKQQETTKYLVHSAVEVDNIRTNYFSLVDSISAANELDYTTSLELPGRPRLYASKEFDIVVIGDAETLTLTRYEVKNGTLVAGDSFSLQPFGVTSLGAQAVLFVSPTKAYYKDNAQMQVIAWNPATMEATSDEPIKLPAELVKDGLRNSLSQWASRGNEAYFTVGWTVATYDRVEPGTVLVSINPETDEITTTAESRCRGLSKTANHDGDLYFFSDVINGLGYAVNAESDAGQKDCILRISKGSTTFDADYLGTTDGAFGEGHIGTVTSVSADGEAWVAVADLSITPNAAGTTYSQWYSAGWSWWHLPLSTLTGATQVAGEPGAYSSFTFASGSDFFVNKSAADYSASTFIELSSGTPTDGLSFPGFLLDVAEVR